jgi:hypothetical protein
MQVWPWLPQYSTYWYKWFAPLFAFMSYRQWPAHISDWVHHLYYTVRSIQLQLNRNW